MDNFLVTIERKVITVGCNIDLCYTETLSRACVSSFDSFAFGPTCENIGKIVLEAFVIR